MVFGNLAINQESNDKGVNYENTKSWEDFLNSEDNNDLLNAWNNELESHINEVAKENKEAIKKHNEHLFSMAHLNGYAEALMDVKEGNIRKIHKIIINNI